ncbi:IQ motif and ubiquitin-like domain-containing protein [Halyomorpha halys]|uniref:IQ motif and ubiquitin-like domain-containing protein n=1 Tax=Halyomorpha halys TaxID=286706 RepID=UPI0034D1D9AE
MKNMYNEALLSNKSSRSKSMDSEVSANGQNEVNVRLLFGRDCINLQLNEEMEIQELVDIVSDMYGLIDKRLGLEMDGEPLMSDMKLKSLTVNHNIELKAVLHINREIISVTINTEDSAQHLDGIAKIYENVSVQTNSTVQLNTRGTQTPNFPLIDRAINTPYTKSVQANPSPNANDKIITVKEYIPYDEMIRYRNEQAVMIQKCIRRFLAQKRIVKMKRERDILLSKKKLQAEEMSYATLLESIKEIMIKRPVLLHDDFAKAYALLANWMKKEKKKIKEEKSGKNKTAAIGNLFNKEMECLHFIQKCRMIQKNENNSKFKFSTLDKSHANLDLNKTHKHVTDCEDKNGFDFKTIYSQLRNRGLEKDDRIVILNRVKQFLESIKAPECTEDMSVLIDREIKMIHLGVNKSFLEGSRKRLEELFSYLSTDPEFNSNSKKVRNISFFQCKNCKELKPLKKFNIDILKSLTFCSSCTVRKELAHSTVILTPYTKMIEQIQRDEIIRGSNEGYINLLQPKSLYYLVQIIWQGRSCISEESDLELLRFIRWDHNFPWSPWNCMLVTENEAEIHQAIEYIETFYREHFIKKIENKHLQAKLKFADLEELNKRIKNSHQQENPYETVSSPKSPKANPTINNQIKKLQSNSLFKESISDLVFARCNYT